MERQITWTNNGIGIIEAEKRQGIAPAFLAEEVVEKIAAFHSSVPGYAVTPLAELSARAKEWGLGNIFVKDESHRFGLNAFKGLGGVYAVSKVICEKLGLDLEKADFSQICSEENKEKIKDITISEKKGKYNETKSNKKSMGSFDSLEFCSCGWIPWSLCDFTTYG